MRKIIITESQLRFITKIINEKRRQTLNENWSDDRLSSPLPFPSSVPNANNRFKTKSRPDHNGVDLKAPSGSKLHAPADGVVHTASYTRQKSKCGGLIKITHANGIESAYCHVKEIFVKKNESVRQGDVIGISGGGSMDQHRGNSQGAHLHYQIKKNGSTVDPFLYTDFGKKNTGKTWFGKQFDKLKGVFDKEELQLWDGCGEDACAGGQGPEEKWEKVKEMQQDLLDRGYYFKFEDDGKFGPYTLGAVNTFQDDHGFDESDIVTQKVLNSMKDEDNKNPNPDKSDPETIRDIIKDRNIEPFSSVVIDAIDQAADKHTNVSRELLYTIASIESGGDPAAENPRSKAAGLFQILPNYQEDYDVDSRTVWDPHKNAKGVARKLNRKYRRLSRFLDRKPEMYELYVSHNQGTRGFKVIRTACDRFGDESAEESLIMAAKSLGIRGRAGSHIYNNMKGNKGGTPCEFLKTWRRIFETHRNTISAML